MRYIITKNKQFFESIGNYNYATLEDLNNLDFRIAVDTETTGLNARKEKMFCIQIADKKNSYIIDLEDYSTSLKFKEYENISIDFCEVIPYLKDRFLIFQNAVFDVKFFYMKNFFPSKIGDTWLMSKLIYNGYPPSFKHGLGDIFKRELGIHLDKHEQANISKVRLSQASTIEYSFRDVEQLVELYEALEKKIDDLGLRFTYELNADFLLALAYMELCGLPISKYKWREKTIEDKKLTDEKANLIIEYIFDKLPEYRDNQISLFDTTKKIKISLTSSKQMIPVFEKLGIPIKVEDKGVTKKSIEVDVIKKTKHEFVNLWVEYKKALHDVTTFGENILEQIEEGRLYSSFNPLVDTGRISSRAGEINFLNFPANKKTRDAFEANEGFDMVVADFEGHINLLF